MGKHLWVFLGFDVGPPTRSEIDKPEINEEAQDVALAIKAALAKEERAIHEEERRNVLVALHAIPSRASVALTASGAVSTAIVAVGTLLARPWLRDVAFWEVWQFCLAVLLLAAVVVTLISVLRAVWIILGALPPVDVNNLLPKENFIEIATQELTEDELETAIDLYMTKITRQDLQDKKEILAKRIADFEIVRNSLRCAFLLSLLLLISGVIIRVGSGDESDGKTNRDKQLFNRAGSTRRNEGSQKPGEGGATQRNQLSGMGQVFPSVGDKPGQAK